MKKKLVPIPKLIKRLDRLFSDFIRQRDGFRCYTCGKQGDKYTIDAGHWVKRSHMSVRFDERNVHAQCKKCNLYLNGNEGTYAVMLVRQYGEGILEELHRLKWQPKKWAREELYSLIEKYKGSKIK